MHYESTPYRSCKIAKFLGYKMIFKVLVMSLGVTYFQNLTFKLLISSSVGDEQKDASLTFLTPLSFHCLHGPACTPVQLTKQLKLDSLLFSFQATVWTGAAPITAPALRESASVTWAGWGRPAATRTP